MRWIAFALIVIFSRVGAVRLSHVSFPLFKRPHSLRALGIPVRHRDEAVLTHAAEPACPDTMKMNTVQSDCRHYRQSDPIEMLRRVPAFYACDPSGAPFLQVEEEEEAGAAAGEEEEAEQPQPKLQNEGEGGSANWLRMFFAGRRKERGDQQQPHQHRHQKPQHHQQQQQRNTVRYFLSSMDAGEAITDSLISAAAAAHAPGSAGAHLDTDQVRLGVTSLAEV